MWILISNEITINPMMRTFEPKYFLTHPWIIVPTHFCGEKLYTQMGFSFSPVRSNLADRCIHRREFWMVFSEKQCSVLNRINKINFVVWTESSRLKICEQLTKFSCFLPIFRILAQKNFSSNLLKPLDKLLSDSDVLFVLPLNKEE